MADWLLAEDDWTTRERAHRSRVEEFLAPHRERAQIGEPHPVWDFLFRYYSLRPRQLHVWHPGFGVVLGGPDSRAARAYLNRTGYGPHPAGVTVAFEHLRSRVDTVGFVANLLRATASRSPRMNCFGMHEWAMVYRAPAVRHERVPLRLGKDATDAVVESIPLRCTHFDAFRFFTEPAAAMNAGTPSRAEQSGWEQPGCVHANMDLYKWCYKLGPLVESELLIGCLELAADARALDMRASPYDLTGYGFEPIAVETPAGRALYVREQQEVAARAAPLRTAIADRCDQLLAAALTAAGN
ncbi:3-methyladenine DNA glycosylase [Mycolicibacterium stellerae]|uniref:3-methyladenine DNA glycosylase n=1 Tax=Mycolicibacterium stellerae TaxID=2358193 RepID=UPI000F0B720E|nr:3-methyladenine DNA glycosylase [Mycolicibacterium stellerae]